MPKAISSPWFIRVAGFLGLAMASGVVALMAGGGARADQLPGAADRFAVFNTPPVAADANGDGITNDASHRSRGINAAPGFRAWAEADPNQVCVSGYWGNPDPGQISPARACVATSSIQQSTQPVILELMARPGKGKTGAAAIGLVPNGVTSVSITAQDGTSHPAEINGNGFQEALPAPMHSITWADGTGSHTADAAGN